MVVFPTMRRGSPNDLSCHRNHKKGRRFGFDPQLVMGLVVTMVRYRSGRHSIVVIQHIGNVQIWVRFPSGGFMNCWQSMIGYAPFS